MSSVKWQDASWHTSSYSQPAGTDCVEVAQVADTRAIRDSKDPGGPVLTFAFGEWTTFLHGIRSGTHDLP